eukprot:CAMPEP_0181375108 /NCGR_PEP_ID=MMETSP1106-20121128/16436_1 /TAXON_ID=81844 /ORGANISM="Mantoniella antarctica, Strain SL-175" /LENGTH=328 /DNA_ID=CAMNT_0023493251 /DNA_START=174 /DNA_END=1157 /DNA_ORIENTATION=+
MDSAEVKRGKGHKRKALDAGIQNQKVEHAAPGSAERSGGPKAEVKPEGGSSSEESKEKLAELMRVFVELSSQSGSHLQCIIGAGTALGTMVHLLHAMDVGTSSISSDVEKHAGEAHELLCKAVKSKLTASEVNVASVPQLVAVLVRHPLVTGAHVPVSDLAHEVARRAAEAITKLVAKDARVKGIVRAGEGVPMLRALLERQIPRESKVQRAAAGALISLDEHGELIENIRRATESITSVTWSEVAALHDAIKRDVHTLGELAKQDQEYVDVLAAAGALNVITPLLHLGARMGVRAKTRDDAGGAPTNFADIEKEVCYTIGVMASKAK